jgi:hypothetical protein
MHGGNASGRIGLRFLASLEMTVLFTIEESQTNSNIISYSNLAL